MRSLEEISHEVLKCCFAWEPGARLIGNVEARELAALVLAADRITSCPLCGAEPWVNIDCMLCRAASEAGGDG